MNSFSLIQHLTTSVLQALDRKVSKAGSCLCQSEALQETMCSGGLNEGRLMKGLLKG